MTKNNFELFTVFWVVCPLTLHFDNFAGCWINDASYDRDKLSPTIDLDLGDGIARFLTGEGDAFNLALKVCKITGWHLFETH